MDRCLSISRNFFLLRYFFFFSILRSCDIYESIFDNYDRKFHSRSNLFLSVFYVTHRIQWFIIIFLLPLLGNQNIYLILRCNLHVDRQQREYSWTHPMDHARPIHRWKRAISIFPIGREKSVVAKWRRWNHRPDTNLGKDPADCFSGILRRVASAGRPTFR